MRTDTIYPAIGVFLELVILYYVASIPSDSELAGLVVFFIAVSAFIIVYVIGLASFWYGYWKSHRAGNMGHSSLYRLLRRQFILFPATAIMASIIALQAQYTYAKGIPFTATLLLCLLVIGCLFDVLVTILIRNLKKNN